MKYHEMTLEASSAKVERGSDKHWLRQFKVRVLNSPAGEMAEDKAVSVQCDESDLQCQLQKLERRQLDPGGIEALGKSLGLLLFPPAQDNTVKGVRELLAGSLDKVGQDNALRLRLRLPPDLADLPWEFVYLDRLGAGGIAGFLALDPRVAIVRHEALPVPAPLPRVSGDITVLAALASPPSFPPLLDLNQEERILHEALDGQAGIKLKVVKKATLEDVQDGIPGTPVFHFAGHGAFRQKAGDEPGTVTGVGSLVLDDGTVGAEKLGVNLRGNRVRLVVLGGCETGRSSGAYVWGGIAPALARFELPAVVANQYSILDSSAIAFSKAFYGALAGGLAIETAMSRGRIAVYNADTNGRDWGVPVLYLRAEDGELFEGAADPKARAAARQSAEADVSVRVKEVAAGGFVLGAEVGKILDGTLDVNVTVDDIVYGTVVGLKLDTLGSGSVNVKAQADTVGTGGSLTGAKIDTLGGSRSKKSDGDS